MPDAGIGLFGESNTRSLNTPLFIFSFNWAKSVKSPSPEPPGTWQAGTEQLPVIIGPTLLLYVTESQGVAVFVIAVSGFPTCFTQLRQNIKHTRLPVRIIDLIIILADLHMQNQYLKIKNFFHNQAAFKKY